MARIKMDRGLRGLPSRSPSTQESEQENGSSVSYCEEVQDIKQRLRDYLDTVSEGTFATSGELPNAVNPGLYLRDLGTVGLPLSERDGWDIIRICRERSSGKETQDNAQDKYKAYKVVAEHIELRSPKWAKTVQHAVGKAAEQLGIIGGQPSIRADLRNMLLCESGNFEKSCQDMMDEKGLVAKLIIVLPSAYEGGDTVVQIGGQTQTLSASSSKEFNYSYLAYYADAQCSVEPVTSGYRLALTYSLIHQSEGIEESRPSSIPTDHKAAINSILEDWKANVADCPNFSPVYMLDNDYTKGNVALESLKGADQACCHHLYDASKKHGFCVFLAHFEHSTSQSRNPQNGDDDDDDYDNWNQGVEDDRPDWMLEELFTMEGVLVAEKVEISKDDVIQSDIFEGEVSAYEDYEAWLEDAGLDQRICLVVVPRARLDGFLSNAVSIKMHGWTQSSLGKIGNDEDVLGTKEELLKICSAAGGRPTTLANNLGSLVNVAIQLEMPSLIEQAMEGSKAGLNIDALQGIARALPSNRIAAWLPALSIGISRIPFLASRLGAVMVFETEYHTEAHLNTMREKSQHVREEEAMMVGRCLAQSLTQSPKDGLLVVGERDADALVLRAPSHGESFVLDVMVPICKMVIGNMNFLASIVSGLCIETDKDWLSLSTVQRFAAEVIELLGQEMCDHCASQGDNEPKSRGFQPSEQSSYPAIYRTEFKKPMSPQALTTLLQHCKKLELFESAAQLLLPLEHIAARPGMIDHTNLLIPVLESLPSEVVVNPTNLQHYQRLFQVVLLSYMRDYIKVKPSKPVDWTREKRQSYNNCSCLTCSELDDFLASPMKSNWRYKAAERERKHIDRQLYSIDCSTSVDKSKGTPFTLVVTKNNDSYENELRDWQQRCSLAQSTFDCF